MEQKRQHFGLKKYIYPGFFFFDSEAVEVLMHLSQLSCMQWAFFERLNLQPKSCRQYVSY